MLCYANPWPLSQPRKSLVLYVPVVRHSQGIQDPDTYIIAPQRRFLDSATPERQGRFFPPAPSAAAECSFESRLRVKQFGTYLTYLTYARRACSFAQLYQRFSSACRSRPPTKQLTTPVYGPDVPPTSDGHERRHHPRASANFWLLEQPIQQVVPRRVLLEARRSR